MLQIEVREISLAETRNLRRDVLRPHSSLEELASREPAESIAFGARDGQAPGDWRVRGMATKPDARGRGAGSGVLQALVQHAVAHGATRVWCNARTRARTLYERVGFVVASEEFEPPDIGPHYRMELAVGAEG